MDFKPKIGENTFKTQSAGNINGDIVYDTNGDTIVTPFQTPKIQRTNTQVEEK